MATHHKAAIMAVLGRTGMGKSTSIKRELRKARGPVFVWDFKREYGELGFTTTDRLAEFIDLVRGGAKRVAFWPALDQRKRWKQFDVWCRAMYQTKGAALVIEELAFVTTPSMAPDAWRMMTLTGRHEGLKIIATSQRPASVDKDFLGNCTRVRAFGLGYPKDAKAVAEALHMEDHRPLLELGPFEFYERNEGQAVKRGRLAKPRR